MSKLEAECVMFMGRENEGKKVAKKRKEGGTAWHGDPVIPQRGSCRGQGGSCRESGFESDN